MSAGIESADITLDGGQSTAKPYLRKARPNTHSPPTFEYSPRSSVHKRVTFITVVMLLEHLATIATSVYDTGPFLKLKKTGKRGKSWKFFCVLHMQRTLSIA